MNLQQYLIRTEKKEAKDWLTNMLPRHVEKHGEDLTEIEHIIDYLNSDDMPKKLHKMCYRDVLTNAEKWSKKQQKKGKHIIETEEDTELVYNFKQDGMKLVRLVGKNAFVREGYLMRHCVASYYNNGKSNVKVYSLRDESENPHCTIEVSGNNDYINQIKGKGNGHIHPKYVKYIITILEKVFKLKVRDSEMNNLGYSVLSTEISYFLDNYCENVKYITFNGKKYFYNNSKITPIKNALKKIKKDERVI